MSYQLSNVWHVLGPFPIGMREQHFGADPLEAYGGFHKIEHTTTTRFPSDLSHTGDVGWTTVRSDDNKVGPFHFPDVRWEQNQIPFGWSIESYQVWCRGTLKITKQSSVLIQLSGVASFYIDQKRYSGDLYGYNTTSHWVELEKGTHLLETRLVHDVRVFGGGNKMGPQCQFSISIRPLDCSAASLLLDDTTTTAAATTLFYRNNNNSTMAATTLLGKEMIKDILMPSFLHNIGFAGKHGALSIHNITMNPLQVVSIRLVFQAYYHTSDVLTVLRPAVLIQRSNHTTIVSGQQRRIGFYFDLMKNTSMTANDATRFLKATKIHAKIIVTLATPTTTFTLVDDHTTIFSIAWDNAINNNNNNSNNISLSISPCVFSYTFLDFDGSVQYAKAKRPRTLDGDENKPIILALHGAGVDVMKDTFWTNSIDTQESVWIVFPTGRTPWGMDWHGPSMKNAFCSLEGLAKVMDWLFSKSMENHQQSSMDYGWVVVEKSDSFSIGNLNRLIYMGHSNGGQGAWYLATHYPDRAVAVVAAAGYVKIQDYVSYSNWISHSYIDPLLFGMLESAYAEFNNDLYLPNMVDLPILARYGSEDDNVPPLHSRKYVRLLNEYNKDPGLIKVSSVEGKGHWWDTVLNDEEVNTFLKTVTQKQQQNRGHSLLYQKSRHHDKDKSHQFTIVTTNPASTGPIHGIQIEQLIIPYRKSSLRGDIDLDNNRLILKSTNISAFKFYNRQETTVIIDQTTFYHISTNKTILFVLDKSSNKWMIEEKKWPKRGERSRLSYGPIHRLYESSKPLVIVIPSNKDRQQQPSSSYHHLALQIAHDWYLYGGGDSMIVPDDHPMVTFEEIEMTTAGQTIKDDDDGTFFSLYLGVGKENKAMMQLLELEDNHIDVTLEKSSIQIGSRRFDGPGTGLLCLCPGSATNELTIVISGTDFEGLNLACQLLPKQTGMLVPEWVVTSPLTKEQGLGGILGAGFFGNDWQAFGY